jgi:hypothetical protein
MSPDGRAPEAVAWDKGTSLICTWPSERALTHYAARAWVNADGSLVAAVADRAQELQIEVAFAERQNLLSSYQYTAWGRWRRSRASSSMRWLSVFWPLGEDMRM